ASGSSSDASCLYLTEKTCPAGWRMFSSSCYLLSAESGSWEKGRQYCRDRGADLVVIDSSEEQTFLSEFIKKATWYWIGLTDRDEEGTWKWVDGTPLTQKTPSCICVLTLNYLARVPELVTCKKNLDTASKVIPTGPG
uniref:C-type lectin domain-containing protein n=1 Tax=Sander lucioperca TaxID=283035 RepID=A0A8C9XRK0_SANLU